MKQKARVWLCAGLLAVNLWGCGENKTEEMAQQENTAAEQEKRSKRRRRQMPTSRNRIQYPGKKPQKM